MAYDVKQIAKEIYYVFKELQIVIPDLAKYSLTAKNPDWLPIKKGGVVSIRDQILFTCAQKQQSNLDLKKDLLLTCALSFDIVSKANHFDVDHFFPQSEIMEHLDQLSKDQNSLLDIKKELFNLFKKDQLEQGNNDKEAQRYANSIVDKLIPNKSKQLIVTGLRHIYYNYPANLWPISGPVNRAKGRKDSIEAAISFVVKRVVFLLGKKYLSTLVDKATKNLGIDRNQINLDLENDIKNVINVLSKATMEKFITNCNISGINKDNSILPYYLDHQGNIVSMLDFFQKTHIGKTALKFSQETAINAVKACGIARDIAYSTMATELAINEGGFRKLKSVTKGAKKLVGIFRRALQEELNATISIHSSSEPLIVDHSSGSDLGSNDPENVASTINNINSKISNLSDKLIDRIRKRKFQDTNPPSNLSSKKLKLD